MQNELAIMRVMLISLVKAVSEMWGNVFARGLFVQLKYRLHFQVSTMSSAAVINKLKTVIFLNKEFPC